MSYVEDSINVVPIKRDSEVDGNSKKRLSSTLSSARRVLNILDLGVDFVNRMPFSGKLMISPVVLHAALERDIYRKQIRMTHAFGTIGLLMYWNSHNAEKGFAAAQNLVNNHYLPEDPLFWAKVGFDFTYGLGHVASVIAQMRLVTRLLPSFTRNTKKIVTNDIRNRINSYSNSLSEASSAHVQVNASGEYYLGQKTKSSISAIGDLYIGSLLPPSRAKAIFSPLEILGISGFGLVVSKIFSLTK